MGKEKEKEKEVKIQHLPPSAENVHFQDSQFDPYFGVPPLVNTPLRLHSTVGPKKTVMENLGEELREALETLKELGEKDADEKKEN